MWIHYSQLFKNNMNSNIINTLKDFGLTEKQSEIFVYLYKYWAKPASTVANSIWWERTNIYKALKKMWSRWIISEITKRWVKHFFITDKNIFNNQIKEEVKDIENKKNKLDYLNQELKKLDKEIISNRPNISFYEWIDWMELIFDNIYKEIINKSYLSIKMFASNTLESSSKTKFNTFAWDFIQKLKKEKINIEAYLWNWIMLFENIIKTYDTDILENLPAWNSAINTFIFWDFVYIIIFKEIPFWIKIENPEFAQMMHFLLKKSNS